MPKSLPSEMKEDVTMIFLLLKLNKPAAAVNNVDALIFKLQNLRTKITEGKA